MGVAEVEVEEEKRRLRGGVSVEIVEQARMASGIVQRACAMMQSVLAWVVRSRDFT